MLKNVEEISALRGLARRMRRSYETETINPRLLDEYLGDGWDIDRKNKRTIRMKREKKHHVLLEHRMWSILYRMGFTYLSADSGARLSMNPKDPTGPVSQIDVLAVDEDVVLAFECKSSQRVSRRPAFAEDLGKFNLVRESLARACSTQFPSSSRRRVVLSFVTSNISLSKNDKQRAKGATIQLLDQSDIEYYEDLVSHLGPAAKYQLLADLLPGVEIPGLKMRLPAVRTKMGGYDCYAFSVSPSYLLKIAWVSHRSKGKASDIDTYQRMMRRSRLNKIREHIQEGGIFPTNIIISLPKNKLRFERMRQKSDQKNGTLGWLDISPAYKSAWIIDGQHRLYAYSGTDGASKAVLSILAFVDLPPSMQADLFIQINGEQKSVKQSLLQELYAELHWDSPDAKSRIQAIISKVIQTVDEEPESPFYQRILSSDDRRSDTQCLSLNNIYRALNQPGILVVRLRRGKVVEYGPLWAGENEDTLNRIKTVLNFWFGEIRGQASDWWDLGRAPGGGLAMNDGVFACIDVLKSVLQHLDDRGLRPISLEDAELVDELRPFAKVVGGYVGSLSEPERLRFRDLRGTQGRTRRRRWIERELRSNFPDFEPDGLTEYLQQEELRTNSKAKEVVDDVELTIQRVVLGKLKSELGTDEMEWWMKGVPENIRTKASDRFEKDSGRRGHREYYFDLIDYRDIALQNWLIFESVLADGKGSKKKRTSWIVKLNGVRRIVSHPSSATRVSVEDLEQVKAYQTRLKERVAQDED